MKSRTRKDWVEVKKGEEADKRFGLCWRISLVRLGGIPTPIVSTSRKTDGICGSGAYLNGRGVSCDNSLSMPLDIRGKLNSASLTVTRR
jgi:hypothetical protein